MSLLFVLDNKRDTHDAREWARMLPTAFGWVQFNRRKPLALVDDTGQALRLAKQNKQLLIIHRSSITNSSHQGWLREKCDAPVLIVYGEPQPPFLPYLPETDNVYYLKARLPIDFDEGFKRRFKVLWDKYQEQGVLDWQLLEPLNTETLSAIYILCQSYLSTRASGTEARHDGIIKRALTAIDWPDSGEPASGNSESGTLLVWRAVFGDVDVLARAKAEWGAEDEGWQRLVPLLISIERLASGETLTFNAEEVAVAYCALALKLGGKAC